MFLSCAAHMLSLSQADEWLWPLFIITTWLEEIMTGMFRQASLYARYWSQSSFSAPQSVFKSKKGTFLKHAGYFAACKTESLCAIFSESHLETSLWKLLENQLGCMLIGWFVRVTPASACGINSVPITTGCMPLNRKEITFLAAVELKTPTSACFQPNRLL